MDEHLDRRGEARMEAIEGLVTGEMTRDDFIKRAALLGFSASAIGGMLAAAGKADAAAGRAFAGQTVSILVAAEGDDKGVRDKIPEIKKRFGIDVKMTALPGRPAEREALAEREGADLVVRRDHGARLHGLRLRRRRLLRAAEQVAQESATELRLPAATSPRAS